MSPAKLFWTILAAFHFVLGVVLHVVTGEQNLHLAVGFWACLILSKVDQ